MAPSTEQKKLIRAARFARGDMELLDAMLKGAAPRADIKPLEAGLLEDYPTLRGTGRLGLDDIAKVRMERMRLQAGLGVSAEEERGLQKVIDAIPNGLAYQRRIEAAAREWIRGKTSPFTREILLTEYMRLKAIQFVENAGGLGEVYKAPGMLLDGTGKHLTNRRLSDDTAFGQGDVGYDSLLATDLASHVSSRLLSMGRADLLDFGCGEAGAYGELVVNLSGRLGGFKAVAEGGLKAVRFGNGSVLTLTGVSRKRYRHPDYVNYIVGDASDMDLRGEYDEVWDVYGPVTFLADKKGLVEEKYYPLLRREPAGNARIVAAGFGLLGHDGRRIRLDRLQGAVEGLKSTVNRNGRDVLAIRRTSEELKLPIQEVAVEVPSDGSGIVITTYRLRA